ncbi:MAG: DMT family transporter, partial [Gammaproteobacteria bacterium]|nr:DMT family transporter [Gammaproteobacteria bacterium]
MKRVLPTSAGGLQNGVPNGLVPSSVMHGVLWTVLAMSCIALVDGLAKYLAVELNGVQVAWGYFTSMLICLLGLRLVQGRPLRTLGYSSRPRLQLLRAACLVGSLSCLFYSLRFLPLAEATCISFTSPLFIVALAGPVLGERVGLDRWLAVLVGLCGALLIVRPGTEIFQWAALLPLLGAVFFAFFNLVTKRIGASDPLETTLFYTFGGGALLLCLPLPFIWRTPAGQAWLLMLASGALGMLAHRSLVRGLSLANASVLAPINYVRLVWATAIGWLVFGQVPDSAALTGGAVVIASGL